MRLAPSECFSGSFCYYKKQTHNKYFIDLNMVINVVSFDEMPLIT